MATAAPSSPTDRRTRGATLAVAALAVLAVLFVVASAPAAAQSDEPNVTLAFANGSGTQPVDGGASDEVNLTLATEDGPLAEAAYSQVLWSNGESVDDRRLVTTSDPPGLRYDVEPADAGQTLEFEATVYLSDGGTVTDSIGVHVPEPSLTYLGAPAADDRVRVDGDRRVLNFSAFGSSDPEHAPGDLTYRWELSPNADGELQRLSEFEASEYDSDYVAQYRATEADVGQTVGVRVTVVDPSGLTGSESMRVEIGQPGSGGSSDGGNAGRLPPGPSAGDASRDRAAAGEPSFGVRFEELPADVRPGASVSASVRLANRGDGHGYADLGLALGNATPSTTRVPVRSGQSRTMNVSFSTPPLPGEYPVTVRTQDGERTRSLTVAPPAEASADGSSSGESNSGQAERSADDGAGSGTDGGDGSDDVDYAPLLVTVVAIALFGVGARRVFG